MRGVAAGATRASGCGGWMNCLIPPALPRTCDMGSATSVASAIALAVHFELCAAISQRSDEAGVRHATECCRRRHVDLVLYSGDGAAERRRALRSALRA